jgi:hypothetical protein
MSVQQALTLMNSPEIAEAIHCKDGTVDRVAGDSTLDTASRINTLYLAALSRRPRPEEMEKCQGYVAAADAASDTRRVLGDVLWALLNSSEFFLNH